ncbi:MAG: class I SAM-dependent methyltransferase [Gloeomargaritaceae cyanobacterium C42_A2020_066]|nr:class I SAM-dependent methyltransferase [Gloeomargaritaceae cyanobacterium C42_A2020_066]
MSHKKTANFLALGLGLSLWSPLVFISRGATEPAPVQPLIAQLEKDVPYVPTPQSVVDAMLKLAKVSQNDVLMDLGSGDGRIVITAAQTFKVKRAIGIEIDPNLVAESRANAEKAGLTDRVQFVEGNIFTTDFGEATVITMYLLPDINIRLRPQLLRLRPGTRIVSHAFDMGAWKPDQVQEIEGRTIYLWIVPETIPPNLR